MNFRLALVLVIFGVAGLCWLAELIERSGKR